MALFGSQNTSTLGGFGFGTPASTATASSFSSPFASNPTSNTLTGGTAFGFGAPATSSQSLFSGSTFSTPAASSQLAFGQPAAATSSGLSFGGFGAATTMATPQMNFGAASGMSTGLMPVASSAPANIGLGGVDLQSASISGPEVANKKDKAVKETFIPNEILVTFQGFKKFTKDQKTVREEMNRMSSKEIFKVQSRINVLKHELATVSNGIQRNARLIAKLKQDTADEWRYADIIRCTKETPSALQYENTAPSGYFHNLVVNFENQMQKYRQQIEELERHLTSLSQPVALTPNELSFVMKRLHDAFVTLASQLQVVHQRVMHLKEEFISTLDPSQATTFFQNRKNTALNETSLSSLARPVVPEPIIGQSVSKLSITFVQSRAELQLRELAAGNHNLLNKSNSSLGLQQNSSFNALGQPSNLSFGSPSFLSDNNCQTPFGNQKPFMLQKPPSGNKRNKRWTSS